MAISLGAPTEAQAASEAAAVREWVAAWVEWQGPGAVEWRERRWRSVGAQRAPERLTIENAAAVARWIGEEETWDRASARYRRLAERWPALAGRLPRHFEALANFVDADIERLEAIVGWMETNPRSNLYPRQIPLACVDTKWLESRISVVTDLVAGLSGRENCGPEFHEICGLRDFPRMVRLRLLDDSLRSSLCGLGDITAPIEQIARLPLQVSRAYILENIQTGLCFEDLPGAVAFLGLGYGVTLLGQLPWLSGVECVYWGDLDTHGFAILNQARKSLGNVSSVLMDEETLLRNRSMWVREREQCNLSDLSYLTAAERAVYDGLRQQRWGVNVRLEQERIPWAEAWDAITSHRFITNDQIASPAATTTYCKPSS